ncbi:hypothetical protein [Luteitalea sp. TBR-22]|uniref:hypothetical protein n=1 Tax=Luteitalea sp. TBR-22 TaxID=2802971 RepID=UPI001EF56D0D|nr:hypothetical protein [Luteitalea sp. TBR-22]
MLLSVLPRARLGAALLVLASTVLSGWTAVPAVPLTTVGMHRQPSGSSGTPLPDLAQLIKEVRAGLRTDEQLLRQYTFKERRRDVNVSKLGKVQLGPWREFEVYPSDVPGETYKRLVSVNDVPLSAAELEKRDAAHRQRVLDQLEQIRVETPAQRDKRLARKARDAREEQDVIDDVFAVYEVALVGREVRDGRQTIVATLTPRKNARTRSDAGKFLKKIKGRAWINEADRQVIRTELEAVEDITFGLGLLARMQKGSTIMFRRTLVNGEIWLPAEAQYKVVGKTLVFRKFALESTTVFSDYKKFGVSTSEEVTGAVK